MLIYAETPEKLIEIISTVLKLLTNARQKCKASNEKSYLAANLNGRQFLYNSHGLDVLNLLVKYFVPLTHINKVIKLLKFKSAVNLQCF